MQNKLSFRREARKFGMGTLVQFQIRRGRWTEALKTHLYSVSLDLR